jgi:hypothetical protein
MPQSNEGRGTQGADAVVPRSFAKRTLTKLLFVDRVQTRLAKFVVGAVSGAVIVSLFSLGVTRAYQEVRQWIADSQNIKHEEAMMAAKQHIGVNTVEAIPFRIDGSNQQYIAVSTEIPENTGPACVPPRWEIRLLAGAEGAYHVVRGLDMEACNFTGVPGVDYSTYKGDRVPEGYRKTIFDVLDINGDGNEEIYSAVREGGMGSYYSFKINVFTVPERNHYWLSAGGERSDQSLPYDYSRNFRTEQKLVAGWNKEQVI